jgi:hypothetical protein
VLACDGRQRQKQKAESRDKGALTFDRAFPKELQSIVEHIATAIRSGNEADIRSVALPGEDVKSFWSNNVVNLSKLYFTAVYNAKTKEVFLSDDDGGMLSCTIAKKTSNWLIGQCSMNDGT